MATRNSSIRRFNALISAPASLEKRRSVVLVKSAQKLLINKLKVLTELTINCQLPTCPSSHLLEYNVYAYQRSSRTVGRNYQSDTTGFYFMFKK
jgi:hypothetical protein